MKITEKFSVDYERTWQVFKLEEQYGPIRRNFAN